MGRKSIDRKRNTDQELQKKFIEQLSPVVHSNGLSKLTMQKVAQQLGVSKATLYEQFATKEALLSSIVHYKLARLSRYKQLLLAEPSAVEGYKAIMKFLAIELAEVSNQYLSDLQRLYPHLWKDIATFIEEAAQKLEAFYKQGMAANTFRQIHPAILKLSDTFFLYRLTDPAFLQKEQLNIQQAFGHFMQLRLYGLVQQ